jgi:hypothetical protein
LNHKQRRILELAFYEGLSMREAAEITGQSFDTVRHHFYRAIGNLRSIIRRGPDGRITKSTEEAAPSMVSLPIAASRESFERAKPSRHATPLRASRIGSRLSPRIQKAVFARA